MWALDDQVSETGLSEAVRHLIATAQHAECAAT
jgi:hypothetical protein